MKDLESPEHRAMEREMLRAARERKASRGHAHIGVAVLLFIVAFVLYAIGYSGLGVFVAFGAIAEIAAWVLMFRGAQRDR